MKIEDRVTVLCAQALAADDEAEVRRILSQLRFELHLHIEQLRSGLLSAYPASRVRSTALENALRPQGLKPQIAGMNLEDASARRTWQQVVHEIGGEQDPGRALQLSQELSRLLQHHREAPSQFPGGT